MNNKMVNDFIFKYFNENVKDTSFLDNFSKEIYQLILLELNTFNLNRNHAKLNMDQFQYELYLKIKNNKEEV